MVCMGVGGSGRTNLTNLMVVEGRLKFVSIELLLHEEAVCFLFLKF